MRCGEWSAIWGCGARVKYSSGGQSDIDEREAACRAISGG